MIYFLRLLAIFGVLGGILYANESYINKDELLLVQNKKILKQIDESRQELEAFRATFLALQKEKEEQNAKKEEQIQKKLNEIKALKEDNEAILNKIKQEKEELTKLKSSKVVESFSKMKEAPAANILNTMDELDAVNILRSLEAKKMGQILSKMPPQKAAKLSVLIANPTTSKQNNKNQTSNIKKDEDSTIPSKATNDNNNKSLDDLAKQITL